MIEILQMTFAIDGVISWWWSHQHPCFMFQKFVKGDAEVLMNSLKVIATYTCESIILQIKEIQKFKFLMIYQVQVQIQ